MKRWRRRRTTTTHNGGGGIGGATLLVTVRNVNNGVQYDGNTTDPYLVVVLECQFSTIALLAGHIIGYKSHLDFLSAAKNKHHSSGCSCVMCPRRIRGSAVQHWSALHNLPRRWRRPRLTCVFTCSCRGHCRKRGRAPLVKFDNILHTVWQF